MSGQINLVPSVSLPSFRCRQRGRRETLGTRPWPNHLSSKFNGVKIYACAFQLDTVTLSLHLLVHLLIRKKNSTCTCAYVLFASICFVCLAKVLLKFNLAMQAQAHKCRNKNVFPYIVAETRFYLRHNYAKKTKSSISTPRSKMC